MYIFFRSVGSLKAISSIKSYLSRNRCDTPGTPSKLTGTGNQLQFNIKTLLLFCNLILKYCFYGPLYFYRYLLEITWAAGFMDMDRQMFVRQ